MKNKMFSIQPWHTDFAGLMLRMIFGGIFIYNGYLKVLKFNEFLPLFSDIIGIGAKLSFILVIIAELGCGFLVLIGLLTRLAVIPIFITMFVAFFIAHANDQFILKQYPFVLMLLSIVIFVLGSGKYSIDKLIFGKSRQLELQTNI